MRSSVVRGSETGRPQAPASDSRVRFEQAVYGSFPFWDRGYAVLAHSPGCRPEWMAGFRAACQRFGERPAGVSQVGGLFAMRLSRGPWMIVGVSDQGADDQGRPGALAFHALFLRPRDYGKAGFNPFVLSGALRSDWAAGTRDLAAGEWDVEPGVTVPPSDGRSARIARALGTGRRVFLQADRPIDELARAVWSALPSRARRRASVATWAFGNGNRFDLVALPRLSGIDWDSSYLDGGNLAEPPDGKPGSSALSQGGSARPRDEARRFRRWGLAAALPVLLGAALGLASRARHGGPRPIPPAPIAESPPPNRAAYRHDLAHPDEPRRVAEGLVDLADRSGVGIADLGEEPVALMVRLADRLRYRGPRLSADDLARLASEPEADRRRALDWDAQIRRFLPDRPLPRDFARGPLRWQLDVLAWSFHLDPFRGPPSEAPVSLAEALSNSGTVRPGPMAARYPALAEYARFLGRLPRR